MANAPSGSRRFEVALSFPGEHRNFVGAVAAHLANAFQQERVLYDKYHDEEFARLDLNMYLPALYRKESELIVLFLCPEYAAKLWCRLEWRHISQLIATVDAKRIMFLSFGNPGDLSDFGILSGDGYIDILTLTPQTVAEKILKRHGLNQGIATPATRPVPISSDAVHADISRIIKYAPAELIGREAETKLLSDAWDQAVRGEAKRPHVLTFVALGGEGKTSLVAKWAAELAYQDWPGCEGVFAWSFYSQGTREQTAVSSDLFLKEALTFFGDPAMAGSAQGAYDKGRRLAQIVGERRSLIILDGLEPLQYAPTSPTPGELKDQGVAALLRGLAATCEGLCVVTTRYSIPDLRGFWQTTAPETKLTRLSAEAGVRLLQSLGVKGIRLEFEKLVEDVQGHALTLGLLGTYLRDAHRGDIRQRDRVKLEEADAEEQGGHAFRVMDAYALALAGEGERGQRALALLSLLGLFDRPATADCLAALLKAPAIPGLTEPLVGLTEAQRNMALTRLESASLLTVNGDTAQVHFSSLNLPASLDAHPLLREYFGRQLWQNHPEAWRAAHRRLYEHLCETTKDKPHPSLEDLQPLYQAVTHGCQAGMWQEAHDKVWFARILRGEEKYAIKKLGAFSSDLGAVASFFETAWSRVSPAITEADQAGLLSAAGYRLRAVGRLTEAIEPMRVALEMGVKQEDWKEAALSANSLSQLELTLGEVVGALGDAEQSVVYADRSGDAFQRYSRRATHADALHRAGRRAEAEARFREAEALQAKRQPAFPLLYSVRGFQYCDLLLAGAERAVWQAVSGSAGFRPSVSGSQPEPSEGTVSGSGLSSTGEPMSCAAQDVRQNGREASALKIESCRAVALRVVQTLKWAKQESLSLLTIALDHLTLGRAALYAAILENSAIDKPQSEMDHAVGGLRRAGRIDYLPRGLLTRALLHVLDGQGTGPESAQSDLDEAWEIAERGPMPLFLADVHLHRARLFFREAHYPWASPDHDLAEARRLIERHGYWRRKEELEDAEDALEQRQPAVARRTEGN